MNHTALPEYPNQNPLANDSVRGIALKIFSVFCWHVLAPGTHTAVFRKNNNEVPQATTDCSSGYFCTSARFSTNLNPAASSNVAGVSFKLFVFLVVCRFKFKSCVLLVVLPLRVPHCSLRMGCCTPDRTWSVYRTQARDKCAPDAELIMFQMSRHV